MKRSSNYDTRNIIRMNMEPYGMNSFCDKINDDIILFYKDKKIKKDGLISRVKKFDLDKCQRILKKGWNNITVLKDKCVLNDR